MDFENYDNFKVIACPSKDLLTNILLGKNIVSKEDNMAPYFSLGNRVIDMVIFTVC